MLEFRKIDDIHTEVVDQRGFISGELYCMENNWKYSSISIIASASELRQIADKLDELNK